jgi:hypothetical protein
MTPTKLHVGQILVVFAIAFATERPAAEQGQGRGVASSRTPVIQSMKGCAFATATK